MILTQPWEVQELSSEMIMVPSWVRPIRSLIMCRCSNGRSPWIQKRSDMLLAQSLGFNKFIIQTYGVQPVDRETRRLFYTSPAAIYGYCAMLWSQFDHGHYGLYEFLSDPIHIDNIDGINMCVIEHFQGAEMIYHNSDTTEYDQDGYYPPSFWTSSVSPNKIPLHMLKLEICHRYRDHGRLSH